MTTDARANLQRLLPHRPPMLMLTSISSQDADQVHCSSVIQADNPLLRDGLFPVMGGIELLAQAGGTLLGARSEDAATRPGAIVQIKTFRLEPRRIPVNAEIHITARYQAGSSEAALIEGEVACDGQRFFSGTLMIAMLPGETQ